MQIKSVHNISYTLVQLRVECYTGSACLSTDFISLIWLNMLPQTDTDPDVAHLELSKGKQDSRALSEDYRGSPTASVSFRGHKMLQNGSF